MGLCVSYFSSSPPSKTTNNLSDGADIWSTIETTNSNVGRPNKLLGALSDGSGQILESTNVKLYSFLDLTTATMNFKPDFMLGQGDFGEVYRGWVDAETLAPSIAGSCMTVAVRRLNSEYVHDFEDWQENESLITELRKELRVSNEEHRELLHLIRVSFSSRSRSLHLRDLFQSV
ncbi:hypothetical protein F2Q69_00008963 [Brassica cretica]|uniref:Protein kinase domain-containing protein n=1 Tax=Brassica cretica TaxID=69181 RepID=A0A8S9NSL2_BRACR|nr:hypothetical protein F2Q69_00008963 [Brassica cretica]